MSALRVVSYNTRDLLDDRAAVVRVVRSLAPDVLCLQEVPRRLTGPHRVAAFAQECGLMWSGNHRGSGGTTILTALRVDVLEARHERLPVSFPDRTRGYAVARVRVPGHRSLTVASVHLGLDPDERRHHVWRVLDDLVAERVPDVATEAGVVLAGDLNEGTGGAARQLVEERLWPATPDEPTFPAHAPRTPLDVIFTSPDVTVLPRVRLDLDRDDVVAASDHLPVWIDVELGAVR